MESHLLCQCLAEQKAWREGSPLPTASSHAGQGSLTMCGTAPRVLEESVQGASPALVMSSLTPLGSEKSWESCGRD